MPRQIIKLSFYDDFQQGLERSINEVEIIC